MWKALSNKQDDSPSLSICVCINVTNIGIPEPLQSL